MRPRRLPVDLTLYAGQYGVYARPLSVKTVLGSCVALCLWDPQRKLAGLNHFLLPQPARPDDNELLYGPNSCARLLADFHAAGGDPTRCWVAVVGGGSPTGQREGQANVGAANVAAALRALLDVGLRPRRQETGGVCGRKLLFNTGDGSLLVRRLERNMIAAALPAVATAPPPTGLLFPPPADPASRGLSGAP